MQRQLAIERWHATHDNQSRRATANDGRNKKQMGELKFTKSFKNSLCEELNKYFEEQGALLSAKTEYCVQTKYGDNYIDVCIVHEENECALLGIEIEVISDPYQAKMNRDKFRNWVHNSQYRYGGLLHIICGTANISGSKMIQLLRDSYADLQQNKGFLYEFYALDPKDWRASKAIAYDLVQNDWEFQTRLMALAYELFGL